jgi:hypothetical protein
MLAALRSRAARQFALTVALSAKRHLKRRFAGLSDNSGVGVSAGAGGGGDDAGGGGGGGGGGSSAGEGITPSKIAAAARALRPHPEHYDAPCPLPALPPLLSSGVRSADAAVAGAGRGAVALLALWAVHTTFVKAQKGTNLGDILPSASSAKKPARKAKPTKAAAAKAAAAKALAKKKQQKKMMKKKKKKRKRQGSDSDGSDDDADGDDDSDDSDFSG